MNVKIPAKAPQEKRTRKQFFLWVLLMNLGLLFLVSKSFYALSNVFFFASSLVWSSVDERRREIPGRELLTLILGGIGLVAIVLLVAYLGSIAVTSGVVRQLGFIGIWRNCFDILLPTSSIG